MKAIKLTILNGVILTGLTGVVTLLTACDSLQRNTYSSQSPNQMPSSNSYNERPQSTPSKNNIERQQSIFHAEESMESPIDIPPDVLAEIIRSSDHIPKDCSGVNNSVDTCFLASYISLNDDAFADLVVMGQGKMMGANITRFWIFQGTETGYRLVLSDTGLQLIIGDRQTKGFREIDLASMSATRIYIKRYEFSGTKYKLTAEKQENI